MAGDWMRSLFRYQEAAEKFYGGDVETLRQALLLGVVRARVELCDKGSWAWWIDGDEEEYNPTAGNSHEAQWQPVRPVGTYQLTGWFYLDRSSASKIAHGQLLSDLLVSVNEEEERFLGLTFRVEKHIDLNDLWFEPSVHPDRVIGAEDEALDYMADNIQSLTSDPGTIARFQAAANVGSEGFDFESFNALRAQYDALSTTAVAKAAMDAVRKEHRHQSARGGKAKAANDPKAKAMAEIREEWERRRRPGASFAREMHGKFAGILESEGSIKNAISRWRKES
jgi:hypothetical protein